MASRGASLAGGYPEPRRGLRWESNEGRIYPPVYAGLAEVCRLQVPTVVGRAKKSSRTNSELFPCNVLPLRYKRTANDYHELPTITIRGYVIRRNIRRIEALSLVACTAMH